MNNLTLCSSCGIPAVSYVNWKKCDCSRGCGVKFVAMNVRLGISNTHKEELRTKKLFTQPEKERLRFVVYRCQIDMNRSIMMGGCSKIICDGCSYANKRREI